ncbi:hypothetical protein H4W33_003594 [Kibdelosporangium phytohabitans]|nr:hypothetical protein [Kibdelosporangium phytohabitans]
MDRISTGNDISYADNNGEAVDVRRWKDITYPRNPPHVIAFKIW